MPILLLYLIIYIIALAMFYRRKNRLLIFVTGAFGLAFLIIQFAVAIELPFAFATLEAEQIRAIMSAIGMNIDVVSKTTMMIPDSNGWVGMRIGIESSTTIEIAVFVGVIAFYPKFNRRQRLLSLIAGIAGTYILNLIRLLIIIFVVMLFDREMFPIAHNLVGRVIYFVGVIALYWYLLTQPTLTIIHRKQAQGQLES